MAVITWPTTGRPGAALEYAEGLQWDVQINVMRNGRAFTRNLPGARWVATLTVPDDTVQYLTERRQLEALLVSLRGGHKRLRIWHLLTPLPLGTLSGTPTVTTTTAAGATSIPITGTGTVWRGDRLQFGATGQRVMVMADATLSGSVTFEPALRAQVSAGVAVVYDKPTTDFILRTPENMFAARGSLLPGFSVDLVEGYE